MRRSRVWSLTRVCKLLWNSISFRHISTSLSLSLSLSLWLWCIIAENVRGYRFSFKQICEKRRGRMASFVFLLFVANCASTHMCKLETTGSFQYFLVAVVALSLVLILLSILSLSCVHMRRQKQQRSTIFICSSPFPSCRRCHPRVGVCGCYHMKNKKSKRKEIC